MVNWFVFEGLNHLSQLEYLDVSNNNISSLEGLQFERFNELKYIAFDDNFVISLSGIQVICEYFHFRKWYDNLQIKCWCFNVFVIICLAYFSRTYHLHGKYSCLTHSSFFPMHPFSAPPLPPPPKKKRQKIVLMFLRVREKMHWEEMS